VAVAVLLIVPVLVVPVVQAVAVVVLRPPQEEQVLRDKETTEAQVMVAVPLVLVVAQEQLVEQAEQSRWVPLAVTDSNLLSQVQPHITPVAGAVAHSRALAARAVSAVEVVVAITTATHP
jgi:Na+-transporting NADH:ubiquinone oxidoreductase subunit NqrC